MSIFGGKFKYQKQLDMIKILHADWFNGDQKEKRIKYCKKKLKKYKGDANQVIKDIQRVSNHHNQCMISKWAKHHYHNTLSTVSLHTNAEKQCNNHSTHTIAIYHIFYI